MSFINKNDFLIGCDWCKEREIDTGERDAESANELCGMAGWELSYSTITRKHNHFCPECKDK